MNRQEQQPLSSAALALLTELRSWTDSLPPKSVVVREDRNPNYGGLLFEVRPATANAMNVTVGLGSSDGGDIFWGDGYRWESWKATPSEVLEVCEAIKRSFPVPKWLRKWACLSVRTYSPWSAETA